MGRFVQPLFYWKIIEKNLNKKLNKIVNVEN